MVPKVRGTKNFTSKNNNGDGEIKMEFVVKRGVSDSAHPMLVAHSVRVKYLLTTRKLFRIFIFM